MTIASDEIGVDDEHLEGLLLALEADRAGRRAGRQERRPGSVSSISSAAKMPWPIDADANAAEPPKPESRRPAP